MIKAIIFDYGGILTLHGTFTEFYPAYCTKHGCNPEELRDLFKEYWSKVRIGEIDSKILWQRLGELINLPPEQVRHDFITWFGVRKEIFPLLHRLKQKYTLALLSNQIKDWMEESRKKQALDELFKVIIFSYEVGVAKPNPEIFGLLIRKLNLKPQECIFIDDQEKNTVAAVKLGFKTILFESTEKLKSQLAEYGVMV